MHPGAPPKRALAVSQTGGRLGDIRRQRAELVGRQRRRDEVVEPQRGLVVVVLDQLPYRVAGEVGEPVSIFPRAPRRVVGREHEGRSAAPGIQRARDAVVEVAACLDVEPVEQRLPHRVVQETMPPVCVRFDEAGPLGVREREVQVIARDLEGVGEHPRLERAPDDRGGLEDPARRRGQGAEATCHQGQRPVRQVHALGRLAVETPHPVDRPQAPRVQHRVEHLDDPERRAIRDADDPLRERSVALAAEGRVDERGRAARVERLELEARELPRRAPLRHAGADRPGREDEEGARLAHVVRDPLQHLAARAIEPLRVVDQEAHGPERRGDGAHHVRGRAREGLGADPRVERGLGVDPLAQLRREHADERREVVPDRPLEDGAREGVSREDRRGGLQERAQGGERAGIALPARVRDDATALSHDLPRQLAEEAALARAALTLDDDRLAPAGAGAAPELSQLAQLLVAPHQRAGLRRLPSRRGRAERRLAVTHAAQLLHEREGARIALGRRALQERLDDGGEGGRARTDGVLRGRLEDRAGHALGQHPPERVQVRARVREPGAALLLGRCVGGRSRALGLELERRREPEVDEPRAAVRLEHDVARLEVAVDEPASVHRVQGRRERDPEGDGLVERERVRRLQTLGQGRPSHQLHQEVGQAVDLAQLQDRGEPRVVHPGQRRRLASEPARRPGPAPCDLHRDGAAFARPAVHDGRRAPAELLVELDAFDLDSSLADLHEATRSYQIETPLKRLKRPDERDVRARRAPGRRRTRAAGSMLPVL